MRKLSKILVLVLALAMMFTMASMFTASAATATTVYLKPNSNWVQGNTWFAARFWNNSGAEKWEKMTDDDGDGIYECSVPSGMNLVIFCRMNPDKTALSWDSKWDQTVDVTIPATGANLYTVADGAWNNATGSWSTLGNTCAHTPGEAATCTAPQTCTKCGEELAPALGHNYNTAHLCTRCNTQATFTVAGDGAHLGTSFDPGNKANDMTYADGVYTKVYTNVAAGSYKLKVTRDHAWSTAYPSADKAYTVATAGSTVTVTLKGTTVTITVEAPHTCEFVAGEVVAPTYEAEGYTVYTCSCGKTENRDITPKKELPKFPEAVVTPVEDTGLTFALNFGIKGVSIVDGEIVLDPEVITEEYIAEVLEVYGRMYVDYRLTVEGLSTDKLVLNANGEADGFLGGQYDAWSENWVYVPFEDVVIENGKSLMIMEYAASMMGQAGLRQILAEIVSVVVDFDCGVYFTPEFLEANPDMVVTLELIVFNEDENGELTDVITVAENVFTAPVVEDDGFHEFDVTTDVTVGADKEAIPEGTIYDNFFKVVGTVTQRVKEGAVYAIEVGKNATGAIEFTLTQTSYVSVMFSSTGGSNTSLIGIIDAEGNLIANEEGITEVTGANDGKTVVNYTLEPGTYRVVSPVETTTEYKRGARVYTIDVIPAPEVNTLVVGENTIVVDGDMFNEAGLPVEWVVFTAEEKAHYEFVGNNGALCFIFDGEMNLLCLGTGKADLEAGNYLICVGNGALGEINVTVTKTEIVVPEHKNELIIGENNKIVVDGSAVNANGNPIAWVPFVVTEKAHYAMTSDDATALVFIFDAELNLLCGGTGAAVLEPGTYLVCVGNAQIGDIYVQVTMTEIPTDCEHVYVYMNCSICGAPNPYFEHNLMVAGPNKVICNEYHLVDTAGHGNPYQFTTFTITEGGTYKFTSDKLVGFTIFTTEINAEGADWTTGTGLSWTQYIAGDEAKLEAGTYYVGLIFVDGVGEYTINIDKVAEEQPPVEEPHEPELNFFQKIIAWFMELIQKIIAIFKK